jgi:hypothetical protein
MPRRSYSSETNDDDDDESMEGSRSEMSYTAGSSDDDDDEVGTESRNDDDDGDPKDIIPRATTYDDIIRDLQRFERVRLPRGEFAVVELGDDDDAEAADTYLLNKDSVERQMRGEAEEDEDDDDDDEKKEEDGVVVRPVPGRSWQSHGKQPFGLETIAEGPEDHPYSGSTDDHHHQHLPQDGMTVMTY